MRRLLSGGNLTFWLFCQIWASLGGIGVESVLGLGRPVRPWLRARISQGGPGVGRCSLRLFNRWFDLLAFFKIWANLGKVGVESGLGGGVSFAPGSVLELLGVARVWAVAPSNGHLTGGATRLTVFIIGSLP